VTSALGPDEQKGLSAYGHHTHAKLDLANLRKPQYLMPRGWRWSRGMNDLIAICGSSRLGASCHSMQIIEGSGTLVHSPGDTDIARKTGLAATAGKIDRL